MSSQQAHDQPHKSTNGQQQPSEDAISYEWQTYSRGLDFERPPLTFEASKWEELACSRLSADSKGYVYGSAGVRETTDKNRAAFRKWSIVPRRLVKTEGFPDLKTEVLGEALKFPVAMAPVGVLKIFSMYYTATIAHDAHVFALLTPARSRRRTCRLQSRRQRRRPLHPQHRLLNLHRGRRASERRQRTALVPALLAVACARRHHRLAAPACKEGGIYGSLRHTGYLHSWLAAVGYG
jgi:hypothetical protein